MDDKIEKCLYDIKFCIEEINLFLGDTKDDFKKYRKDIMLKRAVERNLTIIGEAVSRTLKADSSYAEKISNARAIIGLRNQVIHSYDNVSDENIWAILINHLPKLELEINQLLLKY